MNRVRMFAPLLAALALLASVVPAQGPLQPAVPDVEVVHDVQYAEGFARDSRRNRLDLWVPKHTAKPPVVMFVHGGAWTGGSKDGWDRLGHALAARGIAFAPINTQQHPFVKPAAMVEDCGRALAWLHRHAAEHGFDGERLFVMGHSSGAHLVTWLGLDRGRLVDAGVPRAALRGVIALSGVYETRPRHAALEKVFGSDAVLRTLASPFVHANEGDPPCLLAWGQHDMPCLSLCARMLRDRLAEVGVPVIAREIAGKNHVDYVLELGLPGEGLLDEIAAFCTSPPVAAAAGTAKAPTTLAWVVATEAERRDVASLIKALAPHGIVIATIEASSPAAVAAAFRRLRPGAAFVGGKGRGGFLAAAARLGPADGLRGRIVAGAPLGARSLADVWPGAESVDLAAPLGAGGQRAPALLLLQAEQDPDAQRAEALHLCAVLLSRGVTVHPVEFAGTSTPAVLAGVGRGGDLVLPLVRSFVCP